MQPDATRLIEKLGITEPLIGFYDAPNARAFDPIIAPAPGKHACVFAFLGAWRKGQMLHLTAENPGCGGAGFAIYNREARPREAFVDFLYGEEGLKASRECMHAWLEQRKPYAAEHPNTLIGPLRESEYKHLMSVTFLVNPDQLSALISGAHYHSSGAGPVQAPFGSGCGMLVQLFYDLEVPQAIIGATDIAMRQYLPPDLLAFTVTKAMFAQLCALDRESFLYKKFWETLQGARKKR